MKQIKSPFGTMLDERAMTDQFLEIHGQDTAEALDRIMKNSYPTPWPPKHPNFKTKLEVFKIKALREGFTKRQVNDFLQLANL